MSSFFLNELSKHFVRRPGQRASASIQEAPHGLRPFPSAPAVIQPVVIVYPGKAKRRINKVSHLAMSRLLSCDPGRSGVAERQLLLPTPTWKLPGHDIDSTQRIELLVGLPYGSRSYPEPFAHAFDVIRDRHIPACSLFPR